MSSFQAVLQVIGCRSEYDIEVLGAGEVSGRTSPVCTSEPKQDMLSTLIPELKVLILSYLSGHDLVKVEQVNRDFRGFVRYHEAFLCKPIIEHHRLRLAQQLTYLNFENVNLIEAIKRYDVKMDIYNGVARGTTGRKIMSVSCVRKFAEIYNKQQARLCPGWVVEERVALSITAILFAVQEHVAGTPEHFSVRHTCQFLRQAGYDLSFMTNSKISPGDGHQIIENTRVNQPFGHNEEAFPALATLSAQGKSPLPDELYGHFGRTTLIKLGLPEALWELGLGSLRYYISDDSYARKVHHDCKLLTKPLRPLASACFLPHVEVCRTRKNMLWEG